MNKIIISATGFPGTTKTWDFLQSSLREPLIALANIIGDRVILSGVDKVEDIVSDGFIVVGSEILEFRGGIYSDTVTIIEEVENVDYNIDINDDTAFDNLPAYKTRYAKCGTEGTDNFPFSQLLTVTKLKDVFNGDYNALDNLPSLFDGVYGSLTNKPDLSGLSLLSQFSNNAESIPYNIAAGKVNSDGSVVFERGMLRVNSHVFTVSRDNGPGFYTIHHNFGTLAYGVSVISIGIIAYPFIFDQSVNSFTIDFRTSGGLEVDTNFTFSMYKVSW